MNLLFDLDGTLTDPLAAIRASLRAAFAHCALAPPADHLLPGCIGPPLHQSLRETLSVPEALVETVIASFRRHQIAEALPLYRMFPEAAACLEEWRQRHRLFVATSKLEENAIRLLEKTRHARFFERIYGSRPDGSLSFKPDLIRHLLTEEGLSQAGTWMIGDRRHDTEGALANGIGSIAVLWGYGDRAEFNSAGAAHVVENWPALRALLTTLA